MITPNHSTQLLHSCIVIIGRLFRYFTFFDPLYSRHFKISNCRTNHVQLQLLCFSLYLSEFYFPLIFRIFNISDCNVLTLHTSVLTTLFFLTVSYVFGVRGQCHHLLLVILYIVIHMKCSKTCMYTVGVWNPQINVVFGCISN